MSRMLAIAYQQFLKSFWCKALSPFRDILKNADDPNFWENPENKPFIEFIDGLKTRYQSKNFREITRKEILDSLLRSLIILDEWIARWCKLPQIAKNYIEPIERLISHL